MTFLARHISLSIDHPATQVYHFASNLENLPKWAAGLSQSIRKAGEEWIADSPMGVIKIKMAKANPFGILDHEVTLPSGAIIYNPMRVIANDEGSECVFTLYRRPGVSDEDFDRDAQAVETDLKQLKSILERL
jgi:hypothetical protein